MVTFTIKKILRTERWTRKSMLAVFRKHGYIHHLFLFSKTIILVTVVYILRYFANNFFYLFINIAENY